jgi:hypothetical protein
MSLTVRCSPAAEPGPAEVTPVPKMIEHADPVHVGYWQHDHFELHVHEVSHSRLTRGHITDPGRSPGKEY